MNKAPIPTNEENRLRVLTEYHVLDTPLEGSFNYLTLLASEICQAPVALLSFVAEDLIHFRANTGLTDETLPREGSFCSWAIIEPDCLMIQDATQDERFCDHPLVTAKLGIRFYASAPLITSDELALGNLVVMDYEARSLSAEQTMLLRALADLTMSQLEWRKRCLQAESSHSGTEELNLQLALKDKLLHRIEQRSTELVRANAELKQQLLEAQESLAILSNSEQRYSMAVRSANDGIWDWDLQTNELFLDPRWKEMLGYQDDEIGNHPDYWLDRIHPEDRELFQMDLESLLGGQAMHFENEHRLMHKDGEYRWILTRGMVARNAQNFVYRIVGSITDVTDRKQAEKQLLHSAFHDSLTGLPNRILFMDRLKRSLGRSRHRPDYKFAALFLDLDRFKVINDSLGHHIGDQLLIAMARRLEASLRPGDMVARLGGDEFAVIVDHISTVHDATMAAERLQQDLALPFPLEGREVFASASIGIAISHPSYEQPEDFLRDADTAMYHAKNHGRGGLELFDNDMHARAVSLLQLETDLRRALTRGEFRVHYQPIISLDNRHIIGFESLIRWEHPQQGLISPAKFVQIAEDTGLIIEMDQWMLRESCAQLRTWQEEFPANPPLSVSVNLSGKQFAHPDLNDRIREILAETTVSPESLKLEITESSLIENPEAAANTLRMLKELGIRISLDDFGTGYSSLSYLHRFPIDTIKIDRSFITRLNVSKNSEIVKAIVTLASNLGMEVIAEGVETDEQIARLTGMNCAYVQGYMFSRPLPANEVRDLLEATWPKVRRMKGMA
jgi:diguanylate cyclase (GGDEF)-like protein/PAS domain S-box-containing protein